MKILVENGAYHGQNMGDVAMLQVAVSRLSKLWDNTTIEVLTTAPDLLLKYCPTVQPLVLVNQNNVFPCLGEFFQRKLPNSQMKQAYASFEWQVSRYLPSLLDPLVQIKLQTRMKYDHQFTMLVHALQRADLVMAAGGGYITDAFPSRVKQTCSIFNIASWLRKPTAMLGQGIGPLKVPELKALAQLVFPRVNLIAIREPEASRRLLEEFGVRRGQAMVTGDDAIELAYKFRKNELANGIGVNLRIASYSEVDSETLELVRAALVDVAIERNAPLIPVPIARSKTSNDCEAIRLLLAEHDPYSDGGEMLDTPLKVIEEVGRCRIVVTGSYHAGVFALAQGIPAICLAKSEYYVHKFLGLARQFGGMGCTVILLENSQLKEQLSHAINDAWESAEIVRPQLLRLASEQIELSLSAYKTMCKFVKN